MQISTINTPEELEQLHSFSISHLLWGTKSIPETSVQIAFLRDTGLLLKITCQESNPLRMFLHHNDPVYKDSAVEAFFHFLPSKTATYLNLEMNANGALLAMYGTSRNARNYFTQEQLLACNCHARRMTDCWTVSLAVPLKVLSEIYGTLSPSDIQDFSCNFYKISEDPSHLHFAAYSPVLTETPDFHQPGFFEPCHIIF